MNPRPSDSSSPLLVLAGPTAVGKSEIALLIAERLAGEIVSVDSMQVYRGMDIGTAKPSPEERARAPHHLLDVAAVTEHFDASRFAQLAHSAIDGIRSRGKLPILCGGTGLYFKALLDGLSEAPAADMRVRAELEQTPLPALLRELEGRDPATFARIDRKNPRRVIRALEVIRVTRRPHPEPQVKWEKPRTPDRWQFGFTREVGDLRQRIDKRVELMFGQGLVAEAKVLLEQGLEQNRIAMQALGYRQVVEHVRGERSLPETIEVVKAQTRQFARRQRTWFRRQMALQWIQIAPGESASQVAEKTARVVEEGING